MSPDTASLRAHLLASRIAGEVATPREENIRNADRALIDLQAGRP